MTKTGNADGVSGSNDLNNKKAVVCAVNNNIILAPSLQAASFPEIK